MTQSTTASLSPIERMERRELPFNIHIHNHIYHLSIHIHCILYHENTIPSWDLANVWNPPQLISAILYLCKSNTNRGTNSLLLLLLLLLLVEVLLLLLLLLEVFVMGLLFPNPSWYSELPPQLYTNPLSIIEYIYIYNENNDHDKQPSFTIPIAYCWYWALPVNTRECSEPAATWINRFFWRVRANTKAIQIVYI